MPTAKLPNVAPKASVRGARPLDAGKAATVLDATSVSVVLAGVPLGVNVAGAKLHVTNACWLQLKLIWLLNPPAGETVTLTLPDCPDLRLSAD